MWNASEKRDTNVRREHTAHAICGRFHPSGNWLVTVAGKADELFIWDAHTGKRIEALVAGHHNQWVSNCAFSPDGRELATSGADGLIRVWDFGQRTVRREIVASNRALFTTTYSRDGSEIITGDENGELHVFRCSTGQRRCHVRIGTSAITSLAVSPDGRTLAAGVGKAIALIDYPTCDVRKSFGPCAVGQLAYSPDGELIAVGGEASRDIVVFSTDGEEQYRLPHTCGISGLSFSPDGRLLATWGQDNEFWIWDVERRQLRAEMKGHDFWLSRVEFSPDGNTIATWGLDGTVRWWRAAPPDQPLGQRAELQRMLLLPSTTLVGPS
jgi:WD40 repeat protein